MRIPRIFHPAPTVAGTTVELEPGAARHVLSVLRLEDGAQVELFDGAGGASRGRLQLIKPRLARVMLDTNAAVDRETRLRVELALGISRGERMDLAIQKSVELGVAAIQPLLTRRSVVRLEGERARKRTAHWMGIVRGACEQCGRNTLPLLGPPLRFDAWLEQQLAGTAVGGLEPAGDGALALMPTPGAEQGLKALQPPDNDRILLLIGPEGGLDSAERGAAEAAGFIAVRLGPRVLRTETAAIAAVSALMALWGDLG